MKKTISHIRKTISLVVLINSLVVSTTCAQVYDKTLHYQFRSMEIGPWDFAPEDYYAVKIPFIRNHKAYSGAYKHWQWSGFHSGFKIKFDEAKSTTKRIAPRRAIQTDLVLEKLQQAQEVEKELIALNSREATLQAQRMLDTSYSDYRPRFNKKIKSIEKYAEYIINKSHGKMTEIYSVIDDMHLVREMILYMHKTSPIEQEDPGKREREYIAYLKELEKLELQAIQLVEVCKFLY